jgi:hypothetical protein
MLLQTMSNSDETQGPAGISSSEPSSAHSVWTRQQPAVGAPARVPGEEPKRGRGDSWLLQTVALLVVVAFIYFRNRPTWSISPQIAAFVAEYWWVAASLVLSLIVYRVVPWRLTRWRADTLQKLTVAFLVGFGVMQLIVANAPPAQRSLGEQFVVSEVAVSFTGAELSLIEKGPPRWDASASSDVRSAADRAISDFSYGLGRGVGEAISGSGREGTNYDAWLAVYMSFSVPPEGRPRTPDMDVTLRDDRGHGYGAAARSYKSFGFGPMRAGHIYRERVLFNVFSDATQFVVRIGSNEVVITPRRLT